MRACLLLLPALALPALDAPPPPAVPPVFKASGGQRLPAELRTSSFTWDKIHYDQPSLVLGNKRIGFRELAEPAAEPSPVIVVDGRKVARIQFWGGTSGDNWGYPFKTRAGAAVALSTDPDARSITLRKPYVQANGEDATFTLALRPAGDGQVAVEWDLGVAQERIDAEPRAFAGVAPWLMSAGPQAPCTVNGQAIAITAATAPGGREQRLAAGAALEFVHEPATPLAAFALALPARYPFTALGTFTDGAGHLFIKTAPPRAVAHDRFVIDFGRCAPAAADAPPPVAGIDFWAQDRLHVPRSTTRNLWPNPGFEQGLRYWSWWHGGGRYAPGREQEFSVGEDARFGRRALLIRPGQPGGMALQSFTLPVVKGRAYTVSFHAKGEKEGARLAFGVESPLAGSAHTYQKAFASRFPLTAGWQRHSFSFTPDTPAIMLVVEAPCVTAIDGIQIEEGAVATDYVEPAVQGELVTADGDDQLALGQPIDAVFVVRGAPGATVAADLRLDNLFHERLFAHTASVTLDAQGEARIPLALPAERLGAGVFVLEAALRAGDGPAERDFHRLSIMPYLANRHATKDVFGNLGPALCSRTSDLGRQYMRWGFGSSTYGRQKPEWAAIADRFRMANYLMIVSDLATGDDRAFLTEMRFTLTAITPEQERRIEDIAFRVVAAHPWGTSWSISTESECSPMIRAGDFGEWAKVQLATWRGVKRANRDAIVLPDGGTSGYSRLRGHRETGGYLAATAGKVRWDAIAVHPYGAVDGVRGSWDLDVEVQRLSDQMAEHGYGKETPIDLTEGFNECPLKVQEWNTGCNDYYNNGKPTYAFGWKEYLQACWAARSYLICLKHWPQVRSYNIWLGRVSMDLHLTPYAVCKVPNTLGHLLGDPVFKADVRPAAGVRAYVFEDRQGRGVAAAWCTIDRVEDGLEAGPQLLVRLGDAPCELIDLMGNPRQAPSAGGVTTLQLGSAPLFLRSAPGGAARLIAALEQAEAAGAGSALALAVQPATDGAIEAVAGNLTGRPLRGELRVAGTAIPFDLPAKGAATLRLPGGGSTATGRLHAWKDDVAIALPGGSGGTVAWDLRYLYVPRTAQPLPADPAAPEWAQVPAIPLANWSIHKPVDGEPVPGGQAGDLAATLQATWDKDNLYLRVACVDDRFLTTNPKRWSPSVGGSDPTLYKNDGCLELYLDTAANGRSNAMKGFDQDDYRYDLYAGNPAAADGPGTVHRLREVYHQLAGGIDMPTKEAAAKGITCRFARRDGTYAYVIILPQRFIEPLKLERGWRAGLGLFIHDNDSPERQWPGKGLSLASEPGAHCDGRPDLWPVMVLGD
jgi:hypothetical protein